MTKEESNAIKSEILKKEGTVTVGRALSIPGVVWLTDMLEIINSHTEKER